MTINLLKVAALPMGGGCLASLPAEKNEAKKPAGNQLVPLEEIVADLWLRIKELREHDELEFPPIDLGPIGGDGPKVWPALEGGYGC